jgi:hypothetical protein
VAGAGQARSAVPPGPEALRTRASQGKPPRPILTTDRYLILFSGAAWHPPSAASPQAPDDHVISPSSATGWLGASSAQKIANFLPRVHLWETTARTVLSKPGCRHVPRRRTVRTYVGIERRC